MDLVNGLDLKEFASSRQSDFSFKQMVCPLLKDIGGLLRKLNEQSHVHHRDLKPANILVDEVETKISGRLSLKLIDFGLAVNSNEYIAGPGGTELTATQLNFAIGYLDQITKNVFNAMDIQGLVMTSYWMYLLYIGETHMWLKEVVDRYRSTTIVGPVPYSRYLMNDGAKQKVLNIIGKDDEFMKKYKTFLKTFYPQWCPYPYECYTNISDWTMFDREVDILCL